MINRDDGEAGARLREQERAVPTRGFGRLWRTGRSAVTLARAALGARDHVDTRVIEALVGRLGELKGVGMKMGQILSFIDPSMPAETRKLLSLLQRNAPASEWAAVQEVVRAALGADAEALIAAMERMPFSVASVGQVHRAEVEDVQAVVKVRHPGIEQAFEADFAAARGGVGFANTVLFGIASAASELIEECRAVMLSECDFEREAAHQRTFRSWLATEASGVVVPEVLTRWSKGGVLTTRYEPGVSLQEFLAGRPSQSERDAAGRSLFRVMVGGFHRLGLLYADPHPGNFAFRRGEVVVYDFGCIRAYTRPETQAFSGMAHALRGGDRAGLLRAARAFGFGIEGREREEIFERFATSFFAPMLVRGPSKIAPDGAVEASRMMRDKFALAKLRLPPQLLFLLRLRFGLYAVLSELGARADWGALEAEWANAEAHGFVRPRP